MNKVMFDALTLSEKIEVWNEFCRENSWETEIYDNDDSFFDMFFLTAPIEAVRATYYGSYDYYDDYCYFDGNGNISSFNLDDEFLSIIDIDEMLEYYAQYEPK
jgi:hypothetical protein